MESRPKHEIIREVECSRRQIVRDFRRFKFHAIDQNALVVTSALIKEGWRDWLYRIRRTVQRTHESVRRHPYRYAFGSLAGGALIGFIRFKKRFNPARLHAG